MAHQYEGYNISRRSDFATGRGTMTDDELLFISRHHYRGMSGASIAKMLNRSIPDVEAVRGRLDGLVAREVIEIAPPPAVPTPPYVSPSIRLRLLPVVENMALIAARISAEYGVTVEDLRGQSRKAVVVEPRQAAFHACYAVTTDEGDHKWSLPQIGRFFGDRDHTTVLHGIKRHARRLIEASKVAG